MRGYKLKPGRIIKTLIHHVKFLIYNVKRIFISDVILLKITNDGYTVSINFDNSLLISSTTLDIINPFKPPYLSNKKLLTETFKELLKQLPIQNRRRKPLVIPIAMENFAIEELDYIEEAFKSAGARFSKDVVFNNDELKKIFGC